MTKEKLAQKLDGKEFNSFRDDNTKEAIKLAEDFDLLIVVGYSDDIVSFNGKIHDEAGEGEKNYFDLNGFLPNFESAKEEWESEEDASNWVDRKRKSHWIIGEFGEDGVWKFQFNDYVKYHSSEFSVVEDGEVWCLGKVLDLSKLF